MDKRQKKRCVLAKPEEPCWGKLQLIYLEYAKEFGSRLYYICETHKDGKYKDGKYKETRRNRTRV